LSVTGGVGASVGYRTEAPPAALEPQPRRADNCDDDSDDNEDDDDDDDDDTNDDDDDDDDDDAPTGGVGASVGDRSEASPAALEPQTRRAADDDNHDEDDEDDDDDNYSFLTISCRVFRRS
jgi:hypothetical protein